MSLAAIPSDEEIIQLYHAGNLAQELARFHEGDAGDDQFIQRCVSLHNDGKIDLVGVPEQPAFGEVSGHAFFTAQHFFCKAIPALRAKATALMECCRILVEKGGADLAANEPNGAFRLWCRSNPDEVPGIVKAAEDDDALAKQFVTFALQAANDAKTALRFVRTFPDDRRLSGMAALAGMTISDADETNAALDTLATFIADSADDRVRTNAFLSAFEILKGGDGSERATRFIESASGEPGSQILHGMAQVLWSHLKLLTPDAIERILETLQAVDPKNLGTVGQIDIALQRLLSTEHRSLAIAFLTRKLQDGSLTIENFKSVSHDLGSGGQQQLYELVVRWLISGNVPLCLSAMKLVGSEKDRVFDATIALLGLTPAQQEFLARKAIGFLFLYPIACCSILVSILRGSDRAVQNTVTELLFNPMLLNYAGASKDYLKSIPASDPGYVGIQIALQKDQGFYSDLDATGIIKELHPSEYQHNIARQRTHDQMRDAHKQAESKSIFINLVHRSTILYGKRSVTYVTDPDGSQRPISMDLKEYSAFVEIPRREILDPVGLDYMIRVFRAERLQ